LACPTLHRIALPVVSDWYQHRLRIHLRPRTYFNRSLGSPVGEHPQLNVVPVQRLEPTPRLPSSISARSLKDRKPITLARVLLCCVERKGTVEFARGIQISWYDRG
jgi:hypothetical protein